MIRSSSSSLPKGMLIFPFPFSEQVSCTLVLKKPESCCFSKLNSSGSLARFGVIFRVPLFTASPSLNDLTISSTLRTEYPCSCISSNILTCSFGSPSEINARACPISQLLVLQSHLYGSGQFEQTQIVGDGCPVLADTFAQAFLGQFVLVKQVLIGKCDFYRIQVFTLDVFNQRHFHHVLVVSSADVGGDCFQSGFL